MSEQVKLAMVGCGGIAGAHVTAYEKLIKAGYDKVNIVAVCDTNEKNAKAMAERLAESVGVRPNAYATVEEMLKAETLDGADICTPHAFHHTAAIPCLRKGVNVMVEKPVGITVRATKKMMKAAEKSGAMIAVAEQIRRCLGARAIEWAINEKNMMGTPRFFVMEVFSKTPYNWKEYRMAWRGVKLLGGGFQIFDGGVHFCDMMLHVFGPVEEVVCDMRCFDGPEVKAPVLGKARIDTEHSWLATLRFESGLVGHWNWSCQGYGHEVSNGVYYGDKGSFKDRQKWMHAFQFGADFKAKSGKETSYETIQQRYLKQLGKRKREQVFPYGFDDGITNECWDFVEAIAEGRAPEVDAAAGLRAKSLSIALYESATAGKPIKVADVESGKVRAYQRPIDEYWGI